MNRKTNISVQNNVGRYINPNIIVDDKYRGYQSGDILDANSVQHKIEDIIGLVPEEFDTLQEIVDELQKKQDIIQDLSTIRSGAAKGDTAYQKPSSGIPSTDMTTTVLASLAKAEAAAPQSNVYTKGETDTLLDAKANKDGYYENMGVGVSNNFIGEPLSVTTGYTLKATGYDPSQPELEFADGQVNMMEIQGRVVGWNQLCVNPNCEADGGGWHSDGTTNTYSNNTWNAALQGGANRIAVVKNFSLPANHKIYVRFWMKSSVALTSVLISLHGNIGTATKVITDASIVGTVDTWHEYSAILYQSAAATFMTILCNKSGMVEGDNVTFAKGCFHDLTLLNPTLASKQNLTVAEVEAYLASIRTPKPYYAQNAGTLRGAKMLGWQLRKTANLLNPTTKQAKLFTYSYTGHDNEYTVNGWDELTGAALQFTPYNTGVAEVVTLDTNNRFVVPSAGVLEVVEATQGTVITGDISRVCVVATYDGSMDNVYSAYEEDNVEIDSANIYYDDNGVKTQVFEGGVLRSTGDGADDVHDKVYFDAVSEKWKAEVKVGDYVVTGDETWYQHDNQQGLFYARVLTDLPVNNSKFVSSLVTRSKAEALVLIPDNEGRVGTASYMNSIWMRLNGYADNLTGLTNMLSTRYSSGQPVRFWYELATSINHDTLYYKVGNDYVPMEEVFPDGIQGFCSNWASENLVEQAEVDGQLQSITPIATEVFQSDYKELLKTVGDTYISKDKTKDSFDNLLSMLNTNSGSILEGTYSTDGFDEDGTIQFTFTQTS